MSRIDYEDLKQAAVEGSDEALSVLLDWLEGEGVDRVQRQYRHAEILLLRAGRDHGVISYDLFNAAQALRAELNRWSPEDLYGVPPFIEYRLGLTAARVMANARVRATEGSTAGIQNPMYPDGPLVQEPVRRRLWVALEFWRDGFGHPVGIVSLAFSAEAGEARWAMRRPGFMQPERPRPLTGRVAHRIVVSVTAANPYTEGLPVYLNNVTLAVMPSGYGAKV